MRGRWTKLVRVGSIVVGVFLFLQLVVVLVDGVSRGWPGGFEYTYLILASVLGSAGEFMPVAVLVGAAVAGQRREDRDPAGAGLQGDVSPGSIALASAFVVVLTFLLDGFLGAHLLHHAGRALLPEPGTVSADHPAAIAYRDMRPNDWLFFLSRLFDPPPGLSAEARRTVGAMIHAGVAFPLLAGLMLPLGLAIGRASEAGERTRRVRWGMLAATTILVYAPQMATWYLATRGSLPSPRMVYGGYLIVPIAMLLALAWSRGARSGPP